MRRAQKRTSPVLLTLASLLLSLAAAEGVARLIPRYRLSGFAHHFGPGLEKNANYKPDPLLGYVHVPISLTAMNSVANSRGLVNPDYPLRKAAGVTRILVLGDSITEYGVFVSELEDLLNKNGGGRRYELWNAAVAGYNVAQYARLLEAKGDEYAPDYVLIGFCLNDFTYDIPVFYRKPDGTTQVYNFFSEREFMTATPYDVRRWARPLLSPWLLRHSALYRMALTVLHSRNSEALPMFEKYYRSGYSQVSLIQRWAGERGIPVAGMVFPYLMTDQELPNLWRVERRAMPAVLNALEFPWLDLAPVLGGPDPQHWRLGANDPIHPSTEAHRLVAKAAFDFIRRLGWTKERPTARRGT